MGTEDSSLPGTFSRAKTIASLRRVSMPRGMPRGRAAFGLVAVLLGLAAFGVVVSLLVHNSLASARQHQRTSQSFEAARYAVASEESLERKYRLEPGPAVRDSYNAAATAFVDALQAARISGDVRDRAQVDSALAAHRGFEAIVVNLFGAVDSGDATQVLVFDGQEDPVFNALQAQVDVAASDDLREADDALARAAAVQNGVILATPVALVVGLALLAVFWDMLRRRALEALLAERAALAASERRVRALLENGTDMILLLNSDGEVQADQSTPDRFLGFSREVLVGSPFLGCVHPAERARVAVSFDELLQAPGTAVTLGLRCVAADGSDVTLEATLTNLLDDPDVGAVVINCQDITKRQQMEAQLLQAQKMEGIGRLAGGIAHDFNNILTAIIGYASLARREFPEGSAGRDDIDGVLSSATRAGDLTRQLLAFARKQPARPQLVNPNVLIVNLESLLARMLGEDVTLAVALAPEPGMIRIDPVQFEQVLVNLAVNARDAMPEGGELRIATGTALARFDGPDAGPDGELQDCFCLTVADTGTGISPEALPHIFEPFFTTKDPAAGTGLGLSTCYGIVEQAGGHIELDSTPGGGATFRVYLPSATRVGTVASPVI